MTELFDRVFVRVCHVKTHEDRERHIRREFAARGVPEHFFLDFDVPDLGAYESPLSPPVYSLFMKHVGIWREFLETDKPYCLVFEDDVFLAKDFVSKLARCTEELGEQHAAVYLGNAGPYYIALMKLRRGRHLYPASHSRSTDSYLITRSVAKARLGWLGKNPITLPIGHQIDMMDPQLGVQPLWFERPIVEQGTHTGAFATSLPGGKFRPLWLKRILWQWKKYTRQIKGHA